MRILQVVHQCSPVRIGGTELYAPVLRQGLMQRGHQATMFYGAPLPELVYHAHCHTAEPRQPRRRANHRGDLGGARDTRAPTFEKRGLG